MKRFLSKLFLFVSAHAALLAVVFATYVKRYPPEKSFYAASLDKASLLRTQATPRLIFVGGSSMALGMDSGLVARRHGFHPVNMGMNMAIGLEFMLQEVEPFVRPGDVVVVGPEYFLFERHYRADPEYVARMIECRPSLVRVLSARQFKDLLDYGYMHHVGRVLRSMAGQSEKLHDAVVNEYNHRGAFNDNGDIVAHHGVKPGRAANVRFTFTASPTAHAAIEHLNRFHAACRNRGAQVFFTHCPYDERFFKLYLDSILRLEALLKERLSIPMLDTAEDLAYPRELFFDNEVHLNLEGKIKRSEWVASRLGEALGGTRSAPSRR